MTTQLDGIYVRVIAPDGTVTHRAKAFVIDDRLRVAIAEGAVIKPVLSVEVTELVRSPDQGKRTPYRVTTAQGEYELWAEGCGCNSPLKRWTWRDASLVEVPA